jgi:hypothetical protein
LDGQNDLIILPETTLKTMNIFLEILSDRHKDEFILLICDRATFHSLGGLKIPENIMIEFIPSSSPELNPSENMWEEIREKFFGNAVFKNLNGVEDKLVEAALFYENNPQIVESITGWNWIIDAMDKAQKVIY